MFERSSEIGEAVTDAAREAKAKTEQVAGMLSGNDDLERRGRDEAREAGIEDFRADLRVDQAVRAARTGRTGEAC